MQTNVMQIGLVKIFEYADSFEISILDNAQPASVIKKDYNKALKFIKSKARVHKHTDLNGAEYLTVLRPEDDGDGRLLAMTTHNFSKNSYNFFMY